MASWPPLNSPSGATGAQGWARPPPVRALLPSRSVPTAVGSGAAADSGARINTSSVHTAAAAAGGPPSAPYESVIAQVAAEMKFRGITQKQVSLMSGVGATLLNQWLLGRQGARTDATRALSKWLTMIRLLPVGTLPPSAQKRHAMGPPGTAASAAAAEARAAAASRDGAPRAKKIPGWLEEVGEPRIRLPKKRRRPDGKGAGVGLSPLDSASTAGGSFKPKKLKLLSKDSSSGSSQKHARPHQFPRRGGDEFFASDASLAAENSGSGSAAEGLAQNIRLLPALAHCDSASFEEKSEQCLRVTNAAIHERALIESAQSHRSSHAARQFERFPRKPPTDAEETSAAAMKLLVATMPVHWRDMTSSAHQVEVGPTAATTATAAAAASQRVGVISSEPPAAGFRVVDGGTLQPRRVDALADGAAAAAAVPNAALSANVRVLLHRYGTLLAGSSSVRSLSSSSSSSPYNSSNGFIGPTAAAPAAGSAAQVSTTAAPGTMLAAAAGAADASFESMVSFDEFFESPDGHSPAAQMQPSSLQSEVEVADGSCFVAIIRSAPDLFIERKPAPVKPSAPSVDDRQPSTSSAGGGQEGSTAAAAAFVPEPKKSHKKKKKIRVAPPAAEAVDASFAAPSSYSASSAAAIEGGAAAAGAGNDQQLDNLDGQVQLGYDNQHLDGQAHRLPQLRKSTVPLLSVVLREM